MSLFVRFAIFILVLLWLSGIFLLFFIPVWTPSVKLFPMLNMLYSQVCHQIPYKLIHYHNTFSLVCARCAGIYTGAFAASAYVLLTGLKFKTSAKLLVFSSIPMITDVVLYSAGFYPYSHYIAFFTGGLFGTICFFYIFQGLKLLISEFNSGKVN